MVQGATGGLSASAAYTGSRLPVTPQALERLIAGVSEKTGRRTSASAVMRALLRCAEQWDLAARVAGLIEAELTTGEVVWGKVRAAW